MAKKKQLTQEEEGSLLVAGFQSLMSLFLFVMWLLAEFGRPFE